MTQKALLWLIGAVVIVLLGGWAWTSRTNDADDMATTTASTTPDVVTGGTTGTPTSGSAAGSTTVKPGNLPNGPYVVSADESIVVWTGRKPLVLGYEDTGTINVKSGTLMVADGNITSGEFFIDMQSIKVTKTSNTKAGGDKLENHLLSDDFFAAESYPNAKFVIKSVTNGTVTGDLTIKATTKTISFPATITAESETRLHAVADIRLNRANWDIRYGSDTFFDNLGDNLIADEILIKLDLVATK